MFDILSNGFDSCLIHNVLYKHGLWPWLDRCVWHEIWPPNITPHESWVSLQLYFCLTSPNISLLTNSGFYNYNFPSSHDSVLGPFCLMASCKSWFCFINISWIWTRQNYIFNVVKNIAKVYHIPHCHAVYAHRFYFFKHIEAWGLFYQKHFIRGIWLAGRCVTRQSVAWFWNSC